MERKTLENLKEVLGGFIPQAKKALYVYNVNIDIPEIRLVCPGIEELDSSAKEIEGECRDLIISTGCLEYADKPEEFIDWLLAWLDDGGVLYISTLFNCSDDCGLWRFTPAGLNELVADLPIHVMDSFFETDGVGVAIWGIKCQQES